MVLRYRHYRTWSKAVELAYGSLYMRSKGTMERVVSEWVTGACVAYLDGVPVGMFAYDRRDGKIIAEGTYLNKKARGQGAGKAMWLRVLQDFHGPVEVYCSSVGGLCLVHSVARQLPRIDFKVERAAIHPDPAKHIAALAALSNVRVIPRDLPEVKEVKQWNYCHD